MVVIDIAKGIQMDVTSQILERHDNGVDQDENRSYTKLETVDISNSIAGVGIGLPTKLYF